MIKSNNTIKAASVLLGAMMFFACNKFVPEIPDNIGEEIVFSASDVIKRNTRAFTETTLYELSTNGFRILAKVGSDSSVLFNSVVERDGMVWKVPGRKYYFPTGTTMGFYAAYPGSEMPEMSGNDVVINYTENPDEDLVVAESGSVSSASSAIALCFEHVLSQIMLQFKGSAAGIGYAVNSVKINAPSSAGYSFAGHGWKGYGENAEYVISESPVKLSPGSVVSVGETKTFVPGEISVTVNWTCSQKGRDVSTYEADFDLELVQGRKTVVTCTLPDCDGDVVAFTVSADPWEEMRQEISVSRVPEPLKFEANQENGVFMIQDGCCFPERITVSFEYSYDKNEWHSWEDPFNDILEFGTTMHPGVYIRGKNRNGTGYYCNDCDYPEGLRFDFREDNPVKCSGNLMSLVDYNESLTDFNGPHGGFPRLFYGLDQLVSAPELPATRLVEGCYSHMFEGCTSLALAPDLPAMALSDHCYENMFSGCTSLVAAPSLPAVELKEYCYIAMFGDCASLSISPNLPAAQLVEHCYASMFNNCPSLCYIKCLATDLSATSCLSNWVSSVSPTGTFVKTPGVDWPSGRDGIPSGWFNGKLPAPEPLKFEAGSRVTFSMDCSYATCYCDLCEMCNEDSYFEFSYDNRNWAQFEIDDVLEFGTPQHPCLYLRGANPDGFGYWCQDCDCYEGPTFIFHSVNDVKVSCSGNIMSLINSEESLTVIPEKGCFACLFMNAPILTAPELPATTLKEDCYNLMFSGCESLVIAPEFPASIMDQDWAQEYYDEMF